jgi:hypothetical protein
MALAGAAAGKGEIGLLGFARTVDDAADDGKRHRGGNVLQPVFQRPHRIDHIEALAGAAGAGNDVDAAMAQIERFEDIEADPHLFHRIGGERDADGVADAAP